MSHLDVTDATFEEEVLKAEGVILVDFWASWCMPCQMLSPIIEEVAEEVGDAVKVCKMNVDENQKTSATYKVMSIPTVFIFKDGEVAEEIVGLRQKDEYITAIQKYSGSEG